MTIALFITSSDVPLDVINELLEMNYDGCTKPIFKLLTSIAQDGKSCETETPGSIQAYSTEFGGWSVKRLGQHLQSLNRQSKANGTRRVFDGLAVAALDARSGRDRTLIFAKFTSERREVPEDPDFGPPPEWLYVRFRFEDIKPSALAACIHDHLFFGEESIDHVGEDGIFVPHSRSLNNGLF